MSGTFFVFSHRFHLFWQHYTISVYIPGEITKLWDYTRFAHILDLIFLCLSSFLFIQPDVNFKCMTSLTQYHFQWLTLIRILQCAILLWWGNSFHFRSSWPTFMHQTGTNKHSSQTFFFFLTYQTWPSYLGGDIDCILSPALDRSSKTSLSKSARTIQLFLKTYSVEDVWWFCNPSSRAYSFYSPVHKSYSRLDTFFLDKRLPSSVTKSDYEA